MADQSMIRHVTPAVKSDPTAIPKHTPNLPLT